MFPLKPPQWGKRKRFSNPLGGPLFAQPLPTVVPSFLSVDYYERCSCALVTTAVCSADSCGYTLSVQNKSATKRVPSVHAHQLNRPNWPQEVYIRLYMPPNMQLSREVATNRIIKVGLVQRPRGMRARSSTRVEACCLRPFRRTAVPTPKSIMTQTSSYQRSCHT